MWSFLILWSFSLSAVWASPMGKKPSDYDDHLTDPSSAPFSDCPKFCNLVYRPVCGTDGKTYPNACRLKAEACTNEDKDLKIAHEGACSEDQDEVKPVVAAILNEDDVKECPKFCTFEFKQVCGTDGVTYSNKCHLLLESCRGGKEIKIAHPGPCERIPTSAIETEDECPLACGFEYEPVCGSDGVTYGNECQLKFQSCYRNNTLTVEYEGKCESDKPEEAAVVIEGSDEDCPKYCTLIYNPVCGSDGITYANECEFKKKMCNRMDVTILHSGTCPKEDCPKCEDTAADDDPICGSDGVTYDNSCQLQAASCRSPNIIIALHAGECTEGRHALKDFCPTICPALFAPVCGSDGITYSNLCTLRVKACRDNSNLKLAHQGQCTETDRICPQVCPEAYEPVCGTDGITYSNLCLLNSKACLDQIPDLTIAHMGECGSTEEICPEACPSIYDPVCGTDGATYSNICSLRSEACLNNRNLEKAYDGECVDCSGQFTKVCPNDLKPLCGTDGFTYRNRCTFDEAVCLKPSLLVAYEGECSCPEVCHFLYSPVCGSDGETYPNFCVFQKKVCELLVSEKVLTLTHRGKCGEQNCPTFCELTFKPVCGTDGKTYGNECQLRAQACIVQKDIRIKHRGLCDCDTVCDSTLDPVCGSDGKIYNNRCLLELASCRSGTLISVMQDLSFCDYGSNGGLSFRLREPEAAAPLCNDDVSRCKEENLVCGSDGKTYASKCHLDVNNCQRHLNVKVEKTGPCKEGDETVEVINRPSRYDPLKS